MSKQAQKPLSAAGDAMVITPGGPRKRSDVHAVPIGGKIKHIGKEIHLIDKHGKVIHKAPYEKPVGKAPGSMSSGWITYAYWYNNTGTPINMFNTTWFVPPAPTTDNGQTIFLFNGIEPGNGTSILQPVLQWGPSYAGGGSYWTVASWYVTNSAAYYTTLVNVSEGDELVGSMTIISKNSDSSFNYDCKFSNIYNTELTLWYSDELIWATETLESYGVTTQSDYPSGKTSMQNIQLGVAPNLSWGIVDDVADGLQTVVVTDGSINGDVDIDYPT